MAKKEKAIKIKRYKNSMNSSKSTKVKSVLKKGLAGALLIALIVGAGYFIGRPVVNFIVNIGENENNSSITEENTNNENNNDETQTTQNTENLDNEEEAITITEVDNKVYYNANINELSSEDAILSLVDTLKAKGVTHCIVPIKDANGYVYFDSENEYANQAKNQILLNPDDVIATLAKNNITTVAGISVFKDNLITVINRDTSIFYLNTDARWLDNELSAGGKAWANPANEDTRNYIMDLTKEVIEYGFLEILFLDYQIPHSGYLVGMDFKVSESELQNYMSDFANSLIEEAAKNNVDTIFGVDLASVKSNDYSRYTNNPMEMFTTEILFLARTESVLLEEDAAFINNLSSQYNIDTGLWIMDIASDQTINGVTNFVKR